MCGNVCYVKFIVCLLCCLLFVLVDFYELVILSRAGVEAIYESDFDDGEENVMMMSVEKDVELLYFDFDFWWVRYYICLVLIELMYLCGLDLVF